jgi:hypothetical protein
MLELVCCNTGRTIQGVTHKTTAYYGTEIKSVCSSRVMDSPSFHRNTRLSVILVARLLLSLLAQKFSSFEHDCTSRMRAYAPILFVLVREAFSVSYRVGEVPNKRSVLMLLVRLSIPFQIGS